MHTEMWDHPATRRNATQVVADGQIEFSVDGGAPRTLDTLTHWSSGLHLPWALILDDQLKPGPHTARVRLVASKTSSKTALRVFHLLLN